MPSLCSAADVPQQRWHIVAVLCRCLCPSEVCEPEERPRWRVFLRHGMSLGTPQPHLIHYSVGCGEGQRVLKPHQLERSPVILCLIDTAAWTLSNCWPLFLPPEPHIPGDVHTARLQPPPTPSPGCDAPPRKQRARSPKAECAPSWAVWKEKESTETCAEKQK